MAMRLLNVILVSVGNTSCKRARPVKQVMADLAVARTFAYHKVVAINSIDNFRHVNRVEGRSIKKAWGLLLTWTASLAVHV